MTIFFFFFPLCCSLFNLYNLLESPYSRFYVYMKALNLAVSGNVVEHIIPSFKKIDNFLKEWDIGTPDQRELFLAISNVLKENKRYIRLRSYAAFLCFTRVKINLWTVEIYDLFFLL